jgi:hypothetical protein
MSNGEHRPTKADSTGLPLAEEGDQRCWRSGRVRWSALGWRLGRRRGPAEIGPRRLMVEISGTDLTEEEANAAAEIIH